MGGSRIRSLGVGVGIRRGRLDGGPYLSAEATRGRALRTVSAKARAAETRTRGTGRARGARRPVMGRGRCRAVRGAYTRVVLRTAPRKPNTRVTNRITLHLVDGHLGRVAVDKLDKATALARGDLDVGDLAESLEEGTQLILRHVTREATHEDGRVVGVSELVHDHGVEACATLLETEALLLLWDPGVGHALRLHGSRGRHHLVAAEVLELAALVATVLHC
jgi:hypothetical protein